MFERIYVEKHLKTNLQAQRIISQFARSEVREIDKIEDVFGAVRKPYLQKRQGQNLFLGEKKGKLIKPAPEAYGLSGDLHYYFVHAYNCIYECEYCYLQGYFDSPDLVLFLNHEEICNAIEKTTKLAQPGQKVWFHAGEFSDSLALSHISGELPMLFKTFAHLPNAFLELRTKSVNIRSLLQQTPLANVITSFSMAPASRIQQVDGKTPSLELRLSALSQLQAQGFPIAFHFDPIIYSPDVVELYDELIDQILQVVPGPSWQYVSLGVVRFTKDVYQEVQRNYPESIMHEQKMITSFDEKVRYHKPLRMRIMKMLNERLIKSGIPAERIYLCME